QRFGVENGANVGKDGSDSRAGRKSRVLSSLGREKRGMKSTFGWEDVQLFSRLQHLIDVSAEETLRYFLDPHSQRSVVSSRADAIAATHILFSKTLAQRYVLALDENEGFPQLRRYCEL